MKQFQTKLRQLKDQNRFRSLSLPAGLDLSSNDYLGLATHPKLREAAISFFEQYDQIGAAGSRLLRGHSAHHAQLEECAAHFFAAPAALYFASGFQANGALFGALCDRHDIILFDELVHASAREAIQHSHAKHMRVSHNDLNAYEDALKAARGALDGRRSGQIWVALESLYSMDGDIAPLRALYAVAEKYDAVLVIDEAHATGVFGEKGRGLAYELISQYGYERLITLHTCGKALGVAGGLICAKREIVEYMINAARGFIYSTAPMPLQAYLAGKALEIVMSPEGEILRQKLKALSQQAYSLFGGYGTHIVPLMAGSDGAALAQAAALQGEGFDIRAIRPPTVPEGTARLRLSLSALLSAEDINSFHQAYERCMQKDAA